MTNMIDFDYTLEELSLFPKRFTGRNVIDRINEEEGKRSEAEMKELIVSYFREREIVSYTRHLVSFILSMVLLLISFVVMSWIVFGLSIVLFLSSKYFEDKKEIAIKNKNFSDNIL